MSMMLAAFLALAPQSAIKAGILASDFFQRPNGTWVISITFDRGFARTEAMKATFLVTDHTSTPVQTVPVVFDDAGYSTLTLTAPPFDPAHQYHIYIQNMTFNGNPPIDPLQHMLQMQIPVRTPGGAIEPADGEDDANYYLSGQLITARHTKGIGGADAKFEYAFLKDVWGRTHQFTPFADFEASTDPNANPDSLNFGMHWLVPVNPLKGLSRNRKFAHMMLDNTGKVEADHDFTNANALWDLRLRYPLPLIPEGSFQLYAEPAIGQELGSNLRSPVNEARHRMVYRPLLAASVQAVGVVGKPWLAKVTINSSYIRRWPLRDEVTFETKPRDFVSTKLTLIPNGYFGITFGYEWGRKPPAYKLVDHKLAVGLTFQAKYKGP